MSMVLRYFPRKNHTHLKSLFEYTVENCKIIDIGKKYYKRVIFTNNINEKYAETLAKMDESLGYGVNYDIVRKKLMIGGAIEGVFYGINSFGNGELTEQIVEYLIKNKSLSQYLPGDPDNFLKNAIPHSESSIESSVEKAVYFVMSGTSAIVVKGLEDIIIIDSRKYSMRGVGEPANDKVLRGPREGFIESLVVNTGLIRRRIRDTSLRIEKHTIGKRTKTDVALCYIEGKVDKRLLGAIEKKLMNLCLDGVNMGLESIAEVMIGGRWFNPFPRIRYTERPDAACAMIMEGSIILLCDNYPSGMILPTTFFSFTQDTNDFYFTPFIGKYLKMVRLVVYTLSLMLTPVWYLLISTPEILPQWLEFIIPEGDQNVPILLQLVGVEICIDGLKLASLNAPDTMSSSLGIIGGLLLGDFAVSVGWLSENVIFYMSFVAIANFTQPNFELGYAFKFMRIITLILTGLFHVWGFASGILLTVVMIITTPTIKEAPGYLYPLIPFDKEAFVRVMSRVSLDECQKKNK